MGFKVDPFLRHQMEATNQPDGPARRLRVLVRFSGSPDEIRQSPLAVEFISGKTAIGSIDAVDVAPLAELDSVISIHADHVLQPQLNDSVPDIRANQVHAAPLGLNGEGVVVGVIDTGIDIFHHSFRLDDGSSRVLSILDLTLPRFTITMQEPSGGTFSLGFATRVPPTPATKTVAIPFNAQKEDVRTALQGLNVTPKIGADDLQVNGGPLPDKPLVVDFVGQYADRGVVMDWIDRQGTPEPDVKVVRGREFDEAAIADALAKQDETFRHKDTDGHGTNVAGIAAGDGSQAGTIPAPKGLCGLSGRYVGVAPKASLVIVKGALQDSDIIRGVEHIFAKAHPRPAVVNISQGRQTGAHDGTSELELALDLILTETTGKAIVVAAGNNGDGFRHSFKAVERNGKTKIPIIIPPKDVTDELIDIWYTGSGFLRVAVHPPVLPGAPAPGLEWVNPGDPKKIKAFGDAGTVVIRSALDFSANHQNNINIIIEPPRQTTPSNPTPAPRPIRSGPWTIFLEDIGQTATLLDCWVHNLPEPRPEPGDREKRATVHATIGEKDRSLSSTISIPGTARNVITVGAYDPDDGVLASTSGHGPTTNFGEPRHKPDIGAPGVGIVAPKSGARSLACWCDCCTAFYVPYSGTSQAAPHVAGVVALMLQRNPTLSFKAILEILKNKARKPFPDFTPPDNSWGAGKVDALAAVQATPLPPTPTLAGGSAGAAPKDTAVEGAGEAHSPASTQPTLASPAATWPRLLDELGRLQQQLAGRPQLALLAGLVSTHFDEVVRLANSNRRVAARWHRMGGPALVRSLLELLATGSAEPVMRFVIPDTVDGRPMVDLLRRMLAVLDRYGSAALRADIRRHGPVLLALPGSSLAELIPDPGEQGGA